MGSAVHWLAGAARSLLASTLSNAESASQSILAGWAASSPLDTIILEPVNVIRAKHQAPLAFFYFLAALRLHMPSATLKRLNTMMRCLVAIQKDRPCRYAGHYSAHAGLECSPKLLQSVGEREVVHRHAKELFEGALLRVSETRPRHTGGRPVLSIARVQPEIRALRDFAKR